MTSNDKSKAEKTPIQPPPLPPLPAGMANPTSSIQSQQKQQQEQQQRQKQLQLQKQILDNCPPIKIDALLQLLLSTEKHFTDNERIRLFEESNVGFELKNVINTCSGHREKFMKTRQVLNKQLKEAEAKSSSSASSPLQTGVSTPTMTSNPPSNHNNTSNKQTSQQLMHDALKYQQCLAFNACKKRYETYFTCWSRLHPNVKRQIYAHQQKQQDSEYDVICSSERQSLERCVGLLVSRVVRASNSPLSPDDNDY